jgi:catechol 2,3-dioxygenase-like lactoylglutathione lyase family enzyme
VRYIVSHMDAAIAFYADQLGFVIDMRPAPGFAALSRGSLRLYLNEPGAGGAGAIAGGRQPAPGGWNRLQLIVADLPAEVDRLRGANCTFRDNLIEGNGGRQILLEDPSGNPIELLEPRRRISS